MKQDQLMASIDRLERGMCSAFLRDGSVAGVAIVVDAAGRVVDVVPDTGDGLPAEALRASCERHSGGALWISAEAWSAREHGEGPWTGPRPADRPDRREVLMSQLESAGFARTRLWPIVRDGGRVRLGEVEEFRPCGGRLLFWPPAERGEVTRLSERDWGAFLAMLDDGGAPNEALRRAAERYRAQ